GPGDGPHDGRADADPRCRAGADPAARQDRRPELKAKFSVTRTKRGFCPAFFVAAPARGFRLLLHCPARGGPSNAKGIHRIYMAWKKLNGRSACIICERA